MLAPAVVLGCDLPSLAVLFIAVISIAAILRLASKPKKGVGVLIKDRAVQEGDENEDGRAASIFDSDDLVGGSPLHLPHPVGPTGTSFCFHVYAPPSVDKEIPKVDLVGTLDFLTTGKVRKFVPIGAKRLLVVNLQEMTLEMYVPRRGRKYKKNMKKKGNLSPNHAIKNNKNRQVDSSTIASLSDDTTKASRTLKSPGINISTKRLVIENNIDEEEEDVDDVDFEADDKEEVWGPRHFEAAPKTVLKLDDLISVSALSPNRQGGVIEILSCSPKESKFKRVPIGKEKELTPVGNLTQTMEDIIEPPPQKSLKSFRRPSLLSDNREELADVAKMEEWWRGSNYALHARNHSTTSFVASSERKNGDAAELNGESVIVGAGIDEATDADEVSIAPAEVYSDEFVFRSPRDAAEFQRIVMALRTSGKEIQQMYETLETLQANSEAHFPIIEKQGRNAKKKVKNSNTAKEVPSFVSPGVALDDAWRCLNDVAVVNAGLRQYRLYSLMKSDKDEDIIAAAASNVESNEDTNVVNGSNNEEDEEVQKRKEFYEHYRHRRALLGIRDFFSLFVPPIPLDSPALPCSSTCIASESSLERDCNFSGVEVHQLRLRLASALQLRVGSAALYVRAYAKAKTVVQEGWELDLLNNEEISREEGVANEKNDKVVINMKAQNMTRLAYDNERENLIRDRVAQNESYEPATFPSQGYQLVGWHRFAIPQTSAREFWLIPDKDPIETIPSLKQIVTRHPDLHFIVVSFHNDRDNLATYFLLVRSLPIGVDELFDDTLSGYVNSSAKERDKRFELRISVAPGHSWSPLAKVAMQFVAAALFGGKKLNILGAERNNRISFPGMLPSNMTKVKHFGGSLREDSSPTNYVALNAHLTKATPTSLLLHHIATKTCTFDYAVALKADNLPGRVLSVIRMVNVDSQLSAIPSTCMPNLDRETVEDNTSLSTGDDIEPTSDISFWGKIRRFGKPTKKPSSVSASSEKKDELYSDEIDIIYEILDGICVPAREEDRTVNKLVRLNLTRADIERFIIACECDIKAAVARIIKSQTWRFATFPIDQRLCRVELDAEQFYQQGKDNQNNPIFVFRNSLPSPWAGNVKSTMLMILHRLETFFNSRSGLVKVTVIILTGEAECASETSNNKKGVSASSRDDNEQEDKSSTDDGVENDCVAPPEIDSTTAEYHIHSNFQLVQQMYELLSFHYPERLNKALIVQSKAFSKRRISSFVLSPITQTRVVVLNTQAELKKYVFDSELQKLGLAT